ncbi:MAG: hypothetical protein ACSHYA_13235, partial [Opitutaceae bacterium]
EISRHQSNLTPSRFESKTKSDRLLSLNHYSPNLIDPKGVLILVNHLLDDDWVARLKRHYSLVRKKLKKR